MAKNKVTTTTTTTTTTTSSKAKQQYDYFVLDRSGSMQGIWKSTIDGLNEYLGKIKRDSKDLGLTSFVSLLKFDDKFENPYEYVPVTEFKTLDYYTDGPRGGTALNDAVARAIRSLKTRLFGREKSDDVDVTITIYTDGEENSSVEFPNRGQAHFGNNLYGGHHGTQSVQNQAIAALIKQVQDDYGWTITFVGVGTREQVQYVARGMNINVSNVAHYNATPAGTADMMLGLESARSVKSVNYSRGLKSNVGYFSNKAEDDIDSLKPPINPIDPLASNDNP